MNATPTNRPIGFRPSEISAFVNEEVVQQHAEEAAFQWLLRDAAALAPNYRLKDLADLDERVEANLDGLRIAGDYGWKVCEDQLSYNEPGEVFVAGVLAFESGDELRIQKVLGAGEPEEELSRALISSLGWASFQTIEPLLLRLVSSTVSAHRRIGIGAFAVHRKDPGPGLIDAISDKEAIVRARALKAVGELGKVDLFPNLLSQISDKDEACHFYAAWSAARLGSRDATVIAMLGDYIVLASDYAEQALSMVLRCMKKDQAIKLYKKLKGSPNHLRLAAIGAGIIGDPILIPDLIELMNQKDVARAAGDAFAMITGVDIEFSDLDQDAPEMYAAIPSEAPDDESVDLDPDEDLPWPNAESIAAWWQENKKAFKAGRRYLLGRPIDSKTLQASLRCGNQRQRHAAALELAVQNPDQALFEVRTPGKRQMSLLNI